MTQPSLSALSEQSVHRPYCEDRHDTGHQRWLLCPAAADAAASGAERVKKKIGDIFSIWVILGHI